ncbi:hypothetical protein CAOG_01323 [Capsaspora owczarzaki ATCC 30864]|uniref:Anaphase-promoting complex subunit 10 n=1 Tax=Capsaspora owczarzaki (strain ATCC 30864) TaxID=595528 RepID=A0A0D2VIV7_CAPO3|nr:hypothetical protein CAOG_01323 [Capsaspora owczarzaki ATCC 30864]KJE89922.1 hypothetical protein CAOG_001323 [Capsaspora owczarzaki ATCC 30864]|eukprot:XP_004349843.2 hypothetical protein CAOG_01323 [Capsaspora owczarzaki ATCC 30864]
MNGFIRNTSAAVAELPEPPNHDQKPRRCVNHLGMWSVSSAKHGCGMQAMLDNTPTTYWQSEGQQPHHISVQFEKRMAIQEVWLYLNYKSDESYTPSKITLAVGTNVLDLEECSILSVTQPDGWVCFPLPAGTDLVYGNLFRMFITANHDNGRDSHVRQVKLMAPPSAFLPPVLQFQNVDWAQHASLR